MKILDSANILVTGATGFIGKHLIPLLTNKYSNIYALVRKTSEVTFLREYGIKLRYGDLLDKASLKECLEDITVVIHLAALMSDKDYLSKDEFYKVNIFGTKNLIEASAGNVRQFIHISTVGVYGETGQLGVDETYPYGLRLSKYEYSKAEAEKVLLNFAMKNTFPFTILRLGQLYGPYMYYGWPDVIEKIENNSMFIIGKGNRLLQLTYVTDAVKGIIMTIANEKCMGQIFNICGKEMYTLKEIFYSIAKELNRSYPISIPFLPVYVLVLLLENIPKNIKIGFLKYLDLHRLQFFSHHHVYSISKANRIFNYNPHVDLSSGMKEMIKWYFEYRKGCQNG